MFLELNIFFNNNKEIILNQNITNEKNKIYIIQFIQPKF